ncbi:MAG: hypothetical protein ACI4P1_01195 [Erysipelotrichaceae bacterium]
MEFIVAFVFVMLFYIASAFSSKTKNDEIRSENEKLRSELIQEGVIYYPKEGELERALPVIKKRSEKLQISVYESKIDAYYYVKDTPHLRTISMGNVATTEYVDNSGFTKDRQQFRTGRGGLKVFDKNCSAIYISKDLYNEFKKSTGFGYGQYVTNSDKNKDIVLLDFYQYCDYVAYDKGKYNALATSNKLQIKQSYDSKRHTYYIDMFNGNRDSLYYAEGYTLVKIMMKSKITDLQDLIDWLTLKQQ